MSRSCSCMARLDFTIFFFSPHLSPAMGTMSQSSAKLKEYENLARPLTPRRAYVHVCCMRGGGVQFCSTTAADGFRVQPSLPARNS